MEYYAEYDSPVGKLLLKSDGIALTGLWMDREISKHGAEGRDLAVIQRAKRWLDAYFRGEDTDVDFPLAAVGTDFQQQIWDILLTIPFGKTCTYGDIAREMAARRGKERMSAQAVGGAVGRNPISIIIPCHRVIGAGDKLTGYAGGIARKLWLLRHEGWKGEGKI